MSSSITVSGQLFATLKKYLPLGEEEETRLTLPTGSTVADVIEALNIPKEYAGMLVIGDVYVEKETQLTDGAQLNIFPPLAGGLGERTHWYLHKKNTGGAPCPRRHLPGDHGR